MIAVQMQSFRVFLTELSELLNKERFFIDSDVLPKRSLGVETRNLKVVDKGALLLEIDASDDEGYGVSGLMKTHYKYEELSKLMNDRNAKEIVNLLKSL
jgi:hypothetical protein